MGTLDDLKHTEQVYIELETALKNCTIDARAEFQYLCLIAEWVRVERPDLLNDFRDDVNETWGLYPDDEEKG